jgi:CBS domain containing-hemolysin-like protein
MSIAVGLSLVPVLILANAFFVGAEYAVVAIRGAQIEALRAKGRRRTAAAIEALKDHPAASIGAIQVCITMTNLLLGWIGEPAMTGLIERLFGAVVGCIPHRAFVVASMILSFLLVTLLTVVFSELLPKALTLRYVPTVATLTAVPVLQIRRAVTPLVWVMNKLANAVTKPLGLGDVEEMEEAGHSREEVVLLAHEAAADGVLTAAERSLILNTLSMGKRTARQIMVSRIHVDHLDLRRTMAENMRVLEGRLHSRLPLCDGGMDKVFGVVHTKEFLMAYEDDGDPSVMQLIARPPVFVPEKLSVDKLLPAFYEHQTQMLFLVSEYGGVEGIVTLKDVVDELMREAEGTGVPADSATRSTAAS